jgi:hypothetical protein
MASIMEGTTAGAMVDITAGIMADSGDQVLAGVMWASEQ